MQQQIFESINQKTLEYRCIGFEASAPEDHEGSDYSFDADCYNHLKDLAVEGSKLKERQHTLEQELNLVCEQ